MMQFPQRIQRTLAQFTLYKGCLSLLINPGNTHAVYDIEEGLHYSPATRFAVNYVKRDPNVAPILQERYLAPAPNLEALLQCSPDSLGYQYATSLIQAGFDPNFYRPIAVKDDTTYLFMRLRQTHDIWHVITGFGTDVVGELGLKAFEFMQTRRPVAIVLLAGGFLRLLIRCPQSLPELLRQISRGYELGMFAKPLLSQKWEEQWDKSLTQWRRELNIVITARSCPDRVASGSRIVHCQNSHE
ncbi:MAG: Coq4 family protein [Leptolyngbyaceae cyanobacterium bins.59]|nr:Coq4 family protein [Leptolyngbyaceae cyanobacterium bins.59]